MPFPIDVQERFQNLIARHEKLGWPEQAGRRISLPEAS